MIMKEKASKKRKLDQNEDREEKNKKEKKEKKDVDLNGDIVQETPREFDLASFVHSRAIEMEAMSENVKVVGASRNVFQKLPKHMRRRAASHNVKRLPRRLRQQAQIEMDKMPRKVSKRPSRYHRRRPKNLLKEYERRKRNNIWLETHIWHAKRFHMVNKWGYKIALHPNDKGYRAAYRASAKHSLLMDISYYCCIEFFGPEADIICILKKVMPKEIDCTIAAVSYIDGSQQGMSVLYHDSGYPSKPIGPVTFLWRPEMKSCDLRQLWLWIHPSCYREAINEFKTLMGCQTTDSKPNIENSESKVEDSEKILKNETFSKGQLTVTSLKDELVRFRIVGPLSTDILVETFKKPDISEKSYDNSQEENEKNANCSSADNNESQSLETKWWKDYFTGGDKQEVFEQQWQRMAKSTGVSSPNSLPSNIVIGLTVRDPRLSIPLHKDKVMAMHRTGCYYRYDSSVSQSAIWDKHIRQQVKTMKLSDHELNLKRSQTLVPGLEIKLGKEESRIPMLLIQDPGPMEGNQPLPSRPMIGSSERTQWSRHGKPNPTYGSGWDVILPAAWSMPFWVALVYRGARVGGLREMMCVDEEASRQNFPRDFPDTAAGLEEETHVTQQLTEKYHKYPPSKRPNYTKLGVDSPFQCPWSKLVQDWSEMLDIAVDEDEMSRTDVQEALIRSITGRFYVLRNQRALNKLRNVSKLQNDSHYNYLRESHPSITNNFLPAVCHDVTELDKVIIEHAQSLVPVRMSMLQKGNAEEFAMICLPSKDDLDRLAANKDYGGPIEPKHKDHELETRKNHKNAKKNRKWEKTKPKIKITLITEDLITLITDEGQAQGDSLVPNNSQTSVVEEHVKKKGSTTVIGSKQGQPKVATAVSKVKPKSVIDSNARPIIGYISHGKFVYNVGHGVGFGFCSLIGLVRSLHEKPENQPLILLIRNINTLQYRFAYVAINA